MFNLPSQGEWEKAIGLFTEAIKINPNSAVMFAKRGMCYLKISPQATPSLLPTMSTRGGAPPGQFASGREHDRSGVADGAALRIKPGEHPNGGDGFWGAERETPSFLYAMPLEGGERPVVFFEETCLAAKDALPFDVLSRRLHRRLRALGVEVEEVLDEEWSYIPIGGPLPLQTQGVVSFGAAANLVHPATGYSVSRSLKEAGRLAAELGPLLGAGGAGARAPAAPGELSRQFWESLWSHEKRRQAAFHVFGMEFQVTLGAGCCPPPAAPAGCCCTGAGGAA